MNGTKTQPSGVKTTATTTQNVVTKSKLPRKTADQIYVDNSVAFEHRLLKEPLWATRQQIFNELQKDSKKEEPWVAKWIGKALSSISVDGVSGILDIATGTTDIVTKIMDGVAEGEAKFEKATAFFVSGSEESIKDIIQDQIQAKTPEEAAKQAAEKAKEKVKDICDKQMSGVESPLAQALYKIGKKCIMTFLPIALKGTIAGAAVTASLATGVAAPLFVLGVVITYFVAEQQHETAKFNAWLSGRLMEKLNICRQRAAKVLEEREGRETASLSKKFVDAEDAVTATVKVSSSKGTTTEKVGGADILKTLIILRENKLAFEATGIDGTPINLFWPTKEAHEAIARAYVTLRGLLGKMPKDAGYASAVKLTKEQYDAVLKVLDAGNKAPGLGPAETGIGASPPSTDPKFPGNGQIPSEYNRASAPLTNPKFIGNGQIPNEPKASPMPTNTKK